MDNWMSSFRNPLEVVNFLCSLGAAPKAVQSLTGAPKGFVDAVKRDVQTIRVDRGGRRPQSIAALMEKPTMHIFSSVFLKAYIHHSGMPAPRGARGSVLNNHAIIRALWSTESSIRKSTESAFGDDVQFTVDHAIMIATAYQAGKVDLVQHSTCQSYFLQSKTLERVRGAATYGDCPVCRAMIGVGKAKQPTKLPEKSKILRAWGGASFERPAPVTKSA